jgi:putative intracellular protease/amidase
MTREKNVLVILTNEAFLPRGGKGRYSWIDDQWSTIHDPSASEQATDDSALQSAFTETHRLTGIDALEVGYFWLILKRHLNMNVTFCSPRGGAVAVDPTSFDMAQRDDKLKDKVRNDKEFMEKLTHTLPIRWVNPKEYSMCLIPGRHGALFDLPECREVEKCIETIWSNDGYVCAIGHGVAALLNVKTKHGQYLLKDKRVTCFSNAEEKEKHFNDYLPYLLEDKVRARGAHVDTDKPFTPHVVTDDENNLITAQSFPSIKQFMKEIAEKTSKRTGSKSVDIEAVKWQ